MKGGTQQGLMCLVKAMIVMTQFAGLEALVKDALLLLQHHSEESNGANMISHGPYWTRQLGNIAGQVTEKTIPRAAAPRRLQAATRSTRKSS